MENNILDEEFRDQSNQRVEYVGFWPRVGASLIDILVFIPLVVFVILNLIFLKSLLIDFLLAFLMIAYKPYFEYKYGGTLGKSALKIKVVDEEFEKMDLQTSIVRNLIYILPGMLDIFNSFFLFNNPEFQMVDSFEAYAILDEGQDPAGKMLGFLALISALIVLFTREKQAGHDLLAKTYCVYRDE